MKRKNLMKKTEKEGKKDRERKERQRMRRTLNETDCGKMLRNKAHYRKYINYICSKRGERKETQK